MCFNSCDQDISYSDTMYLRLHYITCPASLFSPRSVLNEQVKEKKTIPTVTVFYLGMVNLRIYYLMCPFILKLLFLAIQIAVSRLPYQMNIVLLLQLILITNSKSITKALPTVLTPSLFFQT